MRLHPPIPAPSHSALALAQLACCLLALGFVGCSSQPETWRDATTRRHHTPLQNEGTQALPPMPTWDSEADAAPLHPDYAAGDAARAGEGFDLAMRNPDFPRTCIRSIHIDLTSPRHQVTLVWTGPWAGQCPVGPWDSSPGQGREPFDCDDIDQSNTPDSHCTPKGVFRVKGFSDHLNSVPGCLYATWVVHHPRYVAIHSSGDIPPFPASGGCIRLPHEAAKLIHNNSIAGVTLVQIGGRWTPGPNMRPDLKPTK